MNSTRTHRQDIIKACMNIVKEVTMTHFWIQFFPVQLDESLTTNDYFIGFIRSP